jgi:hypothetical protein
MAVLPQKLTSLLTGRSPQAPETVPLPGIGGVTEGEGPAGQSGFPGSTSSTRHFRGATPRAAKIRADSDTGFEQGLSPVPQTRQASYRGDLPGAAVRGPRATPSVSTPTPRAVEILQGNSPAEFYGGLPLKTRPGFNTTANPLGRDGVAPNSVRDTETPMIRRQPQISIGVPGAANVRNTIAQRWKNAPGQVHGYLSAPRADQGSLLGDVEGAGGAGRGPIAVPVDALNRFVFAGGGVQTWYMLRKMPYVGHGDGARGANLDGTRRYAAGPPDEGLVNAGMGSYGISRARGPVHRPVSFAEPAPWTTNYYDTTPDVGLADTQATAPQAPDQVYTSSQPSRAALVNPTGRR